MCWVIHHRRNRSWFIGGIGAGLFTGRTGAGLFIGGRGAGLFTGLMGTGLLMGSAVVAGGSCHAGQYGWWL